MTRKQYKLLQGVKRAHILWGGETKGRTKLRCLLFIQHTEVLAIKTWLSETTGKPLGFQFLPDDLERELPKITQ